MCIHLTDIPPSQFAEYCVWAESLPGKQVRHKTPISHVECKAHHATLPLLGDIIARYVQRRKSYHYPAHVERVGRGRSHCSPEVIVWSSCNRSRDS